jgi:hypothetical protein
MKIVTMNGNGAQARPRPAPTSPPATAPAKDGTIDAATLRALAFRAIGLGRIDDARVVLERALELNPTDPEFAADAAAIELRAGNATLAVRLADQALALAPGHAMSAFTRGFALSACGHVDAARAQLLVLAGGENASRFRDETPELAELVVRELARISTLPGISAKGSSTGQVNFPLAARFDVLVKYLYALDRLGRLPMWVDCDVRDLYARHIQLRTGGVEPGNPVGKPTLESYLEQFDALIDSMATHGYDAAHPVPVSVHNAMPCDGAHRCAAALALGLTPAFELSDALGYRWDLDWFHTHGFTAHECNVLVRAWAALRRDDAHVAVLWSPAEDAWPAIEKQLAQEMTLVGARTISLPREGFDEMVRDVYSVDGGPRPGPAIEHKIRLLAAYPPRVRIVYLERRADSTDADAIKRRVREAFADAVPVAWFATLHLSASTMETRHLLNVFASETNLGMLRKRRVPDAALIQQLIDAQAFLVQRGIASDDCCVVGGSVPGVLGLRHSDDLDLTVRGSVRRTHFDAGITRLAPCLDLVTEGYARSFGAAPAPSDDELIANPSRHFHVRGMRFAHPAVVLTRKQHQRREKDLRDLPLLAAFLDSGA